MESRDWVSREPSLREKIRNRIIGEMHLGHLRPGARLPSVRQLGQELGADHRAVASVYRTLSREGLVEMRGRAGVFLAAQERLGGDLAGETVDWLAGVLGEARRRRINLLRFPEVVRACLGRVPLSCACIESNADATTSIRLELQEEFGVRTVAVPADRLTGGAPLPAELQAADFLATTAFHAAEVRHCAAELGKPFVLITMPEEMSAIIERRIRSGGLTVIVADPAYGDRFEAVFGGEGAGRIRTIVAADSAALALLSRAEPVLATRAARLVLPDLDLPLLLPRFPSISPESTRDIAAIVIRRNMEAAEPLQAIAAEGAG